MKGDGALRSFQTIAALGPLRRDERGDEPIVGGDVGSVRAIRVEMDVRLAARGPADLERSIGRGDLGQRCVQDRLRGRGGQLMVELGAQVVVD